MIVLLTGSNNFALRQTLQGLVDDSGAEPERHEASDIVSSQLIDLLQGQSLFSTKRLIILDEASKQRTVWADLKNILPKVGDDTTVILTDTAPDKRTATYKWLQKNARVIDHPWWKGSEATLAEKWLSEYAKQSQLKLSSQIIHEMVSRATRSAEDGKPIIDQQQLANAVNQLSFSKQAITAEALDAVLAPSTHENIFELLSASLRRDSEAVQAMIDHLSQTEDGHRAMGLLVSQVANLTALALAEGSMTVDQIAKDIGSHPFALRQLTRYANQLSKHQLALIVETMADADVRLKRSEAEPWVLIRTALLTISQKQKDA